VDDSVLSRQSIVDAEGIVQAYEILHRAVPRTPEGHLDGTRATGEVLELLSKESLPGTALSYVNFDRLHLAAGSAYLFDPVRLGLEVLESVVVDRELESTLRRLKMAGYRISLDDYRPNRCPELLDLADVVKLDVQATVEEDLPLLVEAAGNRGVVLLAEKVETRAQFERYAQLGCSLFQGYFFSRPEPVPDSHLGEQRLPMVRTDWTLAAG
jgi:EAL and modified HD-GYP domain-containing signal transduction protein